MAIRPYPNDLISIYQLFDGTKITIRPIRPEDATIEQEFIQNLSQEAKYFRFMEYLQELSPSMLIRFTQIDYDRELALVAIDKKNGKEKNIGVARYIINADAENCEFAIVVADSWQRKGIGSRLMTSLVKVAQLKGLKKMTGIVFASNVHMLELVQRLGFSISNSEDPTIKIVTKPLS